MLSSNGSGLTPSPGGSNRSSAASPLSSLTRFIPIGTPNNLGFINSSVVPLPPLPESSEERFNAKLACKKADGVFTAPCDTSVLYPTSGGNIHAFKAITPCAILDVVGPPYSKEDGRDCSYYRDIPYDALPYEQGVMSEEERERYWWLEEIDVPKESEMRGIQYTGPQIIEI
ncbi:putative cysteamine dioxygenase [Helianthus annuus]|nr:putative cysteamine dioxygenase [Helianthus annuus]